MDDPTPSSAESPAPRRHLPGARAVQVLLRSLHIVAMALVLGGLAMGGDFEALRIPIYLTILSGILLMIVDLARGCLGITQGSGAGVMLKLALLGLGHLFPADRLPYYLAAAFVASVASHMSGDWRHFSLRTWKVDDKKGKA